MGAIGTYANQLSLKRITIIDYAAGWNVEIWLVSFLVLHGISHLIDLTINTNNYISYLLNGL